MKTVTMHAAKTHLSRMVKQIREGKEFEIIIAVGNAPAARLVPYVGSSKRVLGVDRGTIEISDDFDAIDEKITDLFEGNVPRKGNKK